MNEWRRGIAIEGIASLNQYKESHNRIDESSRICDVALLKPFAIFLSSLSLSRTKRSIPHPGSIRALYTAKGAWTRARLQAIPLKDASCEISETMKTRHPLLLQTYSGRLDREGE